MAFVNDIIDKAARILGRASIQDSTFTNSLDISAAGAAAVQGIAGGTPVVTSQSNITLRTCSAAVIGLVPAAAATDVFVISGIAGGIVKVRELRITGTRSASATNDLIIKKRSTANTGGTSTTLVNVNYDSADAAGVAVVKAYTANPTLGTFVGDMRADKQFLNAPGLGISDIRHYITGENRSKPIFLNGVAESLAINLNGATITGGSLDIWVEWTEE